METDLELAARAVEATLRPAVRTAGRRLHGSRPLGDVILAALLHGDHHAAAVSWWAASGEHVIEAVVHVTDTDIGTASCFVGAALHAHLVCTGEAPTMTVMQSAERAIAYHRGRCSAALEAMVAGA